MTTPDTRSAITAALSNERSIDVIEGVKAAVVREFEALDPTAIITTTDYFNHSFVPDLIVRWSEAGRAEERPVFLRFTLRSALLGRDVPALSAAGPIVLTLREDPADDASREIVRRDVEASPRLLLTEVPALEEAIAVREGVGDRRSPLLDLVKPNIVRGARGLLDASTVQEIAASATPTESDAPGDAAATLERFSTIVGTVFAEDAALRLRRSADILRIGLSENADDLLAMDPNADNLLQGRLSSAELITLLPYLLSRSDVTRSPVFWAQVGSMMDLGRLEEMAPHLEGLDLGPLVTPNLDSWKGGRAYLAAVAEDEALAVGSDEAGWRIRSGMLCLALSNWRVSLAMDGRKLRGRPDSPSARWLDLAGGLTGFDLARVTLQGASRTVEIGAEDNGDVGEDVLTISTSMRDDFFVPTAQVIDRDAEEGDGAITADFPTMLAIAKKLSSLRSLSRTALRLLGYRYPPDPSEFSRFLDRRQTEEPAGGID